jgi:hypothetical protein
LRDGLTVAEVDGGDQFGRVGSDRHRLPALGRAQHLDAIGEGARLDDICDTLRRASAARRAALPRRLAAEGQLQPPTTSISSTATTAATRKKCLRITKGSGRRRNGSAIQCGS